MVSDIDVFLFRLHFLASRKENGLGNTCLGKIQLAELPLPVLLYLFAVIP